MLAFKLIIYMSLMYYCDNFKVCLEYTIVTVLRYGMNIS